jgi:hypothetical protein
LVIENVSVAMENVYEAMENVYEAMENVYEAKENVCVGCQNAGAVKTFCEERPIVLFEGYATDDGEAIVIDGGGKATSVYDLATCGGLLVKRCGHHRDEKTGWGTTCKHKRIVSSRRTSVDMIYEHDEKNMNE